MAAEAVCDGTWDCVDGSDEASCIAEGARPKKLSGHVRYRRGGGVVKILSLCFGTGRKGMIENIDNILNA